MMDEYEAEVQKLQSEKSNAEKHLKSIEAQMLVCFHVVMYIHGTCTWLYTMYMCGFYVIVID